MKEVLLCKYGELALKGLNRGYFEKLLRRELETRLKLAGNFKVTLAQSTIYVEPTDDDCDIDEALRLCRKVFGITTVARAAVAEKNIDDIKRVAKEYLPTYLRGHSSFKADARRSDKKFPLTSPEISRQVGGAVLEAMPYLKVNLQSPSVVVMTEIR